MTHKSRAIILALITIKIREMDKRAEAEAWSQEEQEFARLIRADLDQARREIEYENRR